MNSKKNAVSMNQPIESEIELKKFVLYKGDVQAYYALRVAYLDYNFEEEFLFYALIMANHYDYPQAYYDVFNCLTSIYLNNIEEIDENTAKLAIDYLIKAAEKNHEQAKEIVCDFSIEQMIEGNKSQVERIFNN